MTSTTKVEVNLPPRIHREVASLDSVYGETTDEKVVTILRMWFSQKGMI